MSAGVREAQGLAPVEWEKASPRSHILNESGRSMLSAGARCVYNQPHLNSSSQHSCLEVCLLQEGRTLVPGANSASRVGSDTEWCLVPGGGCLGQRL